MSKKLAPSDAHMQTSGHCDREDDSSATAKSVYNPIRDDNGELFSDDPTLGFDSTPDADSLNRYIWNPIAALDRKGQSTYHHAELGAVQEAIDAAVLAHYAAAS